MRIVVFGTNGQVGHALSRSMQPLGEVVCATRADADFADPQSVRRFLESTGADLIVNASAFTAVDAAETQESTARLVNATTPGEIAAFAKARGALLIHYSTDYVFDGTKAGAYVEADATGPLSAYGRSKLDGERAIAEAGCDHLVFRTSWVHSPRGNNFVKTIVRLASQRDHLRIVADQIGAPTAAGLIADATAHVARRALQERQSGEFRSAVLHLTASGETSWHGLAARVVARATAAGLFGDRSVVVERIASAEYPQAARRPLNSRLDSTAVRDRFGIFLPDWTIGVDQCLDDLLTS